MTPDKRLMWLTMAGVGTALALSSAAIYSAKGQFDVDASLNQSCSVVLPMLLATLVIVLGRRGDALGLREVGKLARVAIGMLLVLVCFVFYDSLTRLSQTQFDRYGVNTVAVISDSCGFPLGLVCLGYLVLFLARWLVRKLESAKGFR